MCVEPLFDSITRSIRSSLLTAQLPQQLTALGVTHDVLSNSLIFIVWYKFILYIYIHTPMYYSDLHVSSHLSHNNIIIVLIIVNGIENTTPNTITVN